MRMYTNTQILSIWVLDSDTSSKWKIRSDEHFEQKIKDIWYDMLTFVVVEVVSKMVIMIMTTLVLLQPIVCLV